MKFTVKRLPHSKLFICSFLGEDNCIHRIIGINHLDCINKACIMYKEIVLKMAELEVDRQLYNNGKR